MSSPLSSGARSRALPSTRRASAVRPDAPLALIVAGMHRSGTSALTRALSLCGLGLPHTLMAKNEFNQMGYWESEAVKQCNDALLHTLGSSWDDVLASRPSRMGRYGKSTLELIKAALRSDYDAGVDIVIKDPRISVLFEPWRDALAELGYATRLVIAVRNPLEVAASLARRDQFPVAKSTLLWLAHLIAIERDSRGLQRVFVNYDDLMGDWRRSFRRLESALDVRLPGWSDAAELEIDRYLSLEARHHTLDPGLLQQRSDLPEWIAPAYEWALAATNADTDAVDASALDAIAASFHSAVDVFAPLLSRVSGSGPIAGAPVQHDFDLCLYSATADSPFSEDTCVRGSIRLSETPQVFTLGAQRSASITALRLDPANQLGRYMLHKLRVLAPSGEALWTWNGEPASVTGPGLEADELPDGCALLRFLTDDPQINLPLPKRSGETQQIDVEITVSAPSEAVIREGRLASMERQMARMARSAEEAQALSMRALSQTTDSAVFVDRRVSALRDDLAAQMRVTDHRREDQLAKVESVVRAIEEKSAAITSIAQNQTKIVEGLADATRGLDERLDAATQTSDARQRAVDERLDAAMESLGARLESADARLDTAMESLGTRLEGADARQRMLHERLEALALAAGRQDQRIADAARTTSSQVEDLKQALIAKFGELEARLAANNALAWRQEQALKDRDAAVAVRDEEIKAVKRSTSWRVTAPLRGAKSVPRAAIHLLRTTARKLRAMLRGRTYAAPTSSPDKHAAQLLAHSPLFDASWYLANNPDVRSAGVDPLTHYLAHGGYEGRAPSAGFDSRWYLAQNPDVAVAGINPLVHYLTAGEREGRAPRPALEAVYQPSIPGNGVHEEAVNRLLAVAAARGQEYEPLPPATAITSRIRAIAFYLPQFHPIPENDAWWGKGFTEWTNVSKAVPQFAGHYQPRLPDELGFYDLRLLDVQRRQVELAKHFGVHGFCFHYYWFSGRKRLLERPLNQFISARDIDFPFCICWANENWTRRWDGMDQEILMEQRHAPEDDLQFIEDLAPLLADPRYIRIDGRPLIVVYRVDILKNPKRTVQVWRDYCRERGIADPYLAAAQTFGTTDPRPFGFDAALEFPPHKIATADISQSQQFINPRFDGKIYSYESVARTDSHVEWPGYTLFKTIMPSWDNEARKPGKGHVFTGSTPAIYKDWLSALCRATDLHFDDEDKKLVFINAWNEWAEGAYLEPDRRFGYAYLRATGDVLASFPSTATSSAWPNERQSPSPLHVIIHAFYPEIFGELLARLKSSPAPIRLHVTCPPERSGEVQAMLEESGLAAPFDLTVVENRGRDVLAFLETLKCANIPDDAYILKLHTKATTHRNDGKDWRDAMLDGLLQPETIQNVLSAFMADDRLGLVAPAQHITPLRIYIGENQPHLDLLLRRGHWAPIREDDVFAVGTMFFTRRRSLQPLLDLNLSADLFEPEDGQRDGTLAHALERLIAMLIVRNGETITDTDAIASGRPLTPNESFHYAVKTGYLFKPPN